MDKLKDYVVKNSVSDLIQGAEDNQSAKKTIKNLLVSSFNNGKKKCSNVFKRVRTLGFATKEIKEGNVSDLFPKTIQSPLELGNEVIPSIQVDSFTEWKTICETGKEAIFENGNQMPIESVGLEKNPSNLKQYIDSVLRTIFFHLCFMKQKPLLYAFTYPIQTGILVALLASSIISLWNFFYSGNQTPPSDYFSEIESQNSFPEKKEEIIAWDQEIAQGQAEVEICRQEEDSIFAQGKKDILDASHLKAKKKSCLELPSPVAEAFDLKEEGKALIETVIESVGPVKLETTERAQLKFVEAIQASHKETQDVNDRLIRTVLDSCDSQVGKGKAEVRLECATNSSIQTENLRAECNTRIENFRTECDAKVSQANARVLHTEATNYCPHQETKIVQVQTTLNSDLCNSNPPLCLKQLKELVPLAEGEYRERNVTSFFMKLRNFFVR